MAQEWAAVDTNVIRQQDFFRGILEISPYSINYYKYIIYYPSNTSVFIIIFNLLLIFLIFK